MHPLRFRLNPNYDSSARSALRGELLGTGFVRKVVRVDSQSSEVASDQVILGGIAGETPGWMPQARGEFLALADRIGTGGSRWIWPLADEAVSDAPSVLSFLRARPNWKFVLCAADILVPSMATRFDDHVRRLLEALAGHPQLGLVVLTSYGIVQDRGRPAPWGTHSAFDAQLQARLIEFLRPGVEFAVLEGDESASAAAAIINSSVGERLAGTAGD